MFTFKELLKLPALKQAALAAGSEGLYHPIRWGYKAEDSSLKKWVHGGELLIISKLPTLEVSFDLYAYIQEAISLQISGAVILIGEDYIKELPENLIHLCNAENFPLITLPWQVPLIDLFEQMGHAISQSTLHTDLEDDLLLNLLFYYQEKKVRFKADQIGFDLHQNYQVLVLDLPAELELSAMEQTHIKAFIQDLAMKIKLFALLTWYNNQLIVLIEPAAELTSFCETILDYVKVNYERVHLGIGSSQEPATLALSYKEALNCIELMAHQKLASGLLQYDNLGIYQLFFELKDTPALENYITHTLGALTNYDQENHTELVTTLQVYLSQNCNILTTSKLLYTHRNTIKYRLSRIEEICHLSLEDPLARLNLHNAILIKELL